MIATATTPIRMLVTTHPLANTGAAVVGATIWKFPRTYADRYE
jgi:hypothetical protein